MPDLPIKILFKKYLDETITREEFSQLYELIRTGGYDRQVLDALLEGTLDSHAFDTGPGNYDKEAVFASLWEKIGESETKEDKSAAVIPMYRRRWFAAGAAAFVLVAAGLTAATIYWNSHHRPAGDVVITGRTAVRTDVPPGKIGAVLTLSNGKQIELDSSQNGLLAQQGNTTLLKQGGLLSYKPEAGRQDSIGGKSSVLYNTITIPRGGQYRLVLPDGSRVWLNAESSLRFPTVFSGNSRDVTLTGEAYFEVEKRKDMPFTVDVDDLKVRVLGTSFNVMAYRDEGSVKTTLLEGAVKVTKEHENALLKPGQQATANSAAAGTMTSRGTMNRRSPVIAVSEADLEEAVAWKNGLFQFNSDDIETIMRQLGRWYDMETRYEGKIPEGHYTGSIGRNIPLSQVLKMLEVNDLHFRIEGKKIIVLK